MCFLSFSEGIIGFKAYDTLQLHFCGIPNWGDCRSHFRSNFFRISNWNNCRSVLGRSSDFSKINNICKLNFPCYRPNFTSKVHCKGFTIYSLWYTLSAFLPNIKLERLQVTVLKPRRDFLKNTNICKISFHCYFPNIFSKLL